jgi:hypothetical protein
LISFWQLILSWRQNTEARDEAYSKIQVHINKMAENSENKPEDSPRNPKRENGSPSSPPSRRNAPGNPTSDGVSELPSKDSPRNGSNPNSPDASFLGSSAKPKELKIEHWTRFEDE